MDFILLGGIFCALKLTHNDIKNKVKSMFFMKK